MGFEERHVKLYNCMDAYMRVNDGFRVGHLIVPLKFDNFGL